MAAVADDAVAEAGPKVGVPHAIVVAEFVNHRAGAVAQHPAAFAAHVGFAAVAVAGATAGAGEANDVEVVVVRVVTVEARDFPGVAEDEAVAVLAVPGFGLGQHHKRRDIGDEPGGVVGSLGIPGARRIHQRVGCGFRDGLGWVVGIGHAHEEHAARPLRPAVMGDGLIVAVAADAAIRGQTLAQGCEMSRATEFFDLPGNLRERGRGMDVGVETGHGTIAGRIEAGGFAEGERANGFLVNRQRGTDGDAPKIFTLARRLAFAAAVNVRVVATAIEQNLPGDFAARFAGVICHEHAEKTFAAHALLQLLLHFRRQLPAHMVWYRQLKRRLGIGLDQLLQKRAASHGERHAALNHGRPLRCWRTHEASGPQVERDCGAGGLRRLRADRWRRPGRFGKID